MTSPSSRDLVIVCTKGTDHELSSVALTIACGGITSGLKVYLFLTSSAVDTVRRRGIFGPRFADGDGHTATAALMCGCGS